MAYFNRGYRFYSSRDHFEKHVLGSSLSDNRPRWIIKLEKDHWQNYKLVTDEQEYYYAACDNIEEAKRIVEYRRNDGTVSINYQKENVQFEKNVYILQLV